MKKLLIICGFLLVSCSSNENAVIVEPQPVVDSVILKSEKSLTTADVVQKMSDSTTKEQVVKIVKEIQVLYNEVEKYKTERLELLKQTQTVTEKIIVRVDTVYIETKKNFSANGFWMVKASTLVASNITFEG